MNAQYSSERKDSSQLPAVKELYEILDREAKRPIAPGKDNLHFQNFDSVIAWLNAIELPTDIFTNDFGKDWEQVLICVEQLIPQVVERTLSVSDREVNLALKSVTNYLGEEDLLKPAKVIFVFGAPSLLRIEAAVKLYKQGLSSILFISGGNPIYKLEQQSETVKYRQYAIEQGVSESAVMVHDGAISIADNVRGGLNCLDRLEIDYSSMILVTSWFSQRRSWAHMMKYVPHETKLYRFNAPSSLNGGLSQNDWWKNERGIKVVFNEYLKMKTSEILNSS